jgi:hypothetical protein
MNANVVLDKAAVLERPHVAEAIRIFRFASRLNKIAIENASSASLKGDGRDFR